MEEYVDYNDIEITDEMIKEVALNIIRDIDEDFSEERAEEFTKRLENFINSSYRDYMDNSEYIRDLRGLYNEMIAFIPEKNAILAIFNLYFNNIDIIIDLRNKNNNQEQLRNLKEKRKTLIDYVKEEKLNIEKEEKKIQKETLDISFYIDFIDNYFNDDSYLSILPNTNDKESLLIIDTILSYYIKEINTIKYLLSEEDDKEYINTLEKYVDIYNKILNYKQSLLIENLDEVSIKENEILYYMNGETSYLYSDIIDNPEIYESIGLLINSIKTGNFKNIKYFTNHSKTRGLVEVRDIRNGTRVLFDVMGYKKYCIVGAVVGKKETTTIYKERLVSRYTKYKLEKNKVFSEDKKLIKVLRGE